MLGARDGEDRGKSKAKGARGKCTITTVSKIEMESNARVERGILSKAWAARGKK